MVCKLESAVATDIAALDVPGCVKMQAEAEVQLDVVKIELMGSCIVLGQDRGSESV